MKYKYKNKYNTELVSNHNSNKKSGFNKKNKINKINKILLFIIFFLLIFFLAGCEKNTEIKNANKILLTDQDFSKLKLEPNYNHELFKDLIKDLKNTNFKKTNLNHSCIIELYYTKKSSSLIQYIICFYIIKKENETIVETNNQEKYNETTYDEIIIEIKKFTNEFDLYQTFQYESSHYRSIESLINENSLGDKSKFFINSEKNYGSELNTENIYFYNLYIVKNKYLIHITSKGSKNAKETLEEIGKTILLKLN